MRTAGRLHRYHLHAYALDISLWIASDKKKFTSAIEGHTVGHGEHTAMSAA